MLKNLAESWREMCETIPVVMGDIQRKNAPPFYLEEHFLDMKEKRFRSGWSD